jgi:adenylate cyclase
MGDGVLVEFPSAVNAVACAVALQERMAAANGDLADDRRIDLRVGINLGDVVVEGGDLYGDGVIIGVRLQEMAEPGGICVSGAVHDQVAGKLPIAFEDLGRCEVKNSTRPVQVFRLLFDQGDGVPASTGQRPHSKLSVAVLPFTNMSGEPEQDYFSDGITEDIITDLSKVSALNVLSRNTTFTFKGKAVAIGQVAQRLKVGYVVEGSVRKAGGRVRITAQLIDAVRDTHLWGERYDRDLNDIFAVQDEIAHAIVAALKVRLLPVEKTAIESRSTNDPKAYQLYLLGRYYRVQHGARNLEAALRFFERALEIDPDYARAWAAVAECQSFLYVRGKSEESGLAAAERALALDPSLAVAHAARGRVLSELERSEEAIAAHEESLRLDPDSFDVQFNFALTCLYMGRYQDAAEHFERAAQLFETNYTSLYFAAIAYRTLGRHAEFGSAARRAIERIEREIALRPDNVRALVFGASTLAHLGERERAEEWATRAQIIGLDDPIDELNLACAFAQMGEPERALDHLESSLRVVLPKTLDWVLRVRELEPLRDHPRYRALIAREEARLAGLKKWH